MMSLLGHEYYFTAGALLRIDAKGYLLNFSVQLCYISMFVFYYLINK